MKRVFCFLVLGMLCPIGSNAQEASSGFDARAVVSAQGAASSLSTESPRFGSPATGGYRVIFYPVWKLNDNWAITGALQSNSRPYFQESFSTAGYGVKDNILLGTLNYLRVSNRGSLMVRVGELPTAFGSFLLHYDDAANALIDMPLQYGYYYKPVTTLGLTGGQVDVTRGKWDGRVQFANSSPANPRSVFKGDQYANWAGGAGYTVRQGLRVGFSGYRGPYLSRDYRFFFPGEAKPNSLPAHAVGVDVQWARGHWNVQGEWQTFLMPYKRVAPFHLEAGYVEAKRVLSPRWSVAGRGGYTDDSFSGFKESYEAVGAFRPNRLQIVKVGYELRHQGQSAIAFDHSFIVQLVTSLHLLSLAGK